MRDKTVRAIGATVILAMITVVAVTHLNSGDDTPAEVTPDTFPEAVATTLGPTEGSQPAETSFEFRIGLLNGLSTDNYWGYYGAEPNVWNAYVLGSTKGALYAIDPATGSLRPELASEDPVEPVEGPDGWYVTVPMAGTLRWSDGIPITAADVAFTFETARSLGLGGGWAEAYPEEITTVEAVSDTELRIEFSSRPSLSLWPYSIGLGPVMAEHAWAETVSASTDAAALYSSSGAMDVSGGPIEIISIEDAVIMARANQGYGEASFTHVRYQVFPDEAAAAKALQAGEIDTILSPRGLQATTVEALGSIEGLAVETSPSNAVRYLGFNLTRTPMSSPAFRQAVATLIDREAAIARVQLDAEAAFTMLPSANASWYDPESAEAIATRFQGTPEARLGVALQRLIEAGYAWTAAPRYENGALVAGEGLTIDGRPPAPLTILTSGDAYDPARPLYAGLIESTIEALGFDVRPVITDFETVVDLAFTTADSGQRQYDMYLLGWTLGNPALPDYYRWFFAGDGKVNSTGYQSAEFAQILAAYEGAVSRQQAAESLWAMERTLASDLPYLVLYHPQITEVYRKDRVGFELDRVLGGIQGRGGGLADLIPSVD